MTLRVQNFQGMNFILKRIYAELFYTDLSKCLFNNSKMKAKVRAVYAKKTTDNDRLES